MAAVGQCFVLSFRRFTTVYTCTENAYLVHGMVSGNGKLAGWRYAHAWIEIGDEIVDDIVAPGHKISKTVYYAVAGVKETELKRYSIYEASRNAAESGTYGPWDTTEICWDERRVSIRN